MTMESEHQALQADFERRLLESAQSDSPPAGATEQAWLRFAASAGTLTPLAAVPPLRSWFQSARALALKWTLIGAIGGGSLVALWLQPAPTPVPAPGSTAAALAQPVVVAPAPLATPPPESLLSAPAPVVAPSGSPTAGVQRRSARASAKTRAGDAVGQSQRSPADYQLAREVAALDAARTALAVGANQSALQQIEQYQRDFPAGELSAEADVVAIEALAAAGDRAAARRAAQTFLERHPHDPHLARVRELGR